MPDRPKKDHLKNVLKITLGEEAQERKKHNTRPQPGDVRLAQSAPMTDRLTRAIKRSQEIDLKKREEEKAGKPQPGDQFMATDEGPSAEERERVRVEKFLRLAKERFKLSAEAESEMRRDALDDLDFRVGNQWPKDVSMQRAIDGRPCLTMNRLPAIIRQVTNEQRQQRPSIQVNPVGDGADTDTAEILQGMIRHIEVVSDAEIAYDTAFEQMVTTGFGAFRIVSEVIDEETNQQELKLKRVKNQFSVYWDPASIEPDYSDARYCFVIEDVPKEEYYDRYSETQAATLADFSSVGDNAPEWANKDAIRVAEYFYITDEDVTETVQPDDGSEPFEQPTGNTQRVVNWAKINAMEIIEQRVIPGDFIPVIAVMGDDMDVNGKRHVAGLVRHAKDPQRMYNYWVSAATEMIALAPKAPFVVAEGQEEGHEREFEQANVRTMAVIRYKPKSVDGQLVPPPERNQYEPPVQAITMMTRQADVDLKAITGLFDPSLGQNKTDQSGRAIASLQKQGEVSNLNFSDNLSRSIRHCGRVLIGMIPHIYDAPRVQRIINPDNTVSHVVIHNQQAEAGQQLLNEKVKKIYDIGVGTYDVTVSVGPSYQTKRQEAVAAQIALVQSNPTVFPIIGDMVVRNMDWPQSKEMADRLKKMLPPQLQDQGDEMEPEQQVMALQAQMQQLMQQHNIVTQALEKATNIINTKQVEQDGKVAIEKFKGEMQLAIAEVNAKTQETQFRMQLEQDLWKELHGSSHELGMQADQQGHEAEMQANAPQPTNGAAQ